MKKELTSIADLLRLSSEDLNENAPRTQETFATVSALNIIATIIEDVRDGIKEEAAPEVKVPTNVEDLIKRIVGAEIVKTLGPQRPQNPSQKRKK
jgi:hypothetical protein